MRIGFFTDTYFPQVSGVATSIKTLKEELEKLGHEVYIFTTTDPDAEEFEEDIVRMPSVPFVSFSDRRIVVRGMWFAYQIAKELELELIHTHTEFGAGFLGQMVGSKLQIPVIHTYHTMYEDYLHYIAKGKVVRPAHVRVFSKLFVNHCDGVVCPSRRVINTLLSYGVDIPMRTIPTGIEVARFKRPDITSEMIAKLREELGIEENQLMLLSLSRISYEKNIQAILKGLPQVLAEIPTAKLIIVGKGPYRAGLEKLAQELEIAENITFVGEVPNDEVAIYYKAADYFVSASTSETQGLTYTEALSAGTQCVVEGNDYLNELLDDPSLGVTFETDEEFAATLLAYIKADIPVDQEILDRKMHVISAEYFGEEMERFYLEMVAENQAAEKVPILHVPEPIDRIRYKIKSFRK